MACVCVATTLFFLRRESTVDEITNKTKNVRTKFMLMQIFYLCEWAKYMTQTLLHTHAHSQTDRQLSLGCTKQQWLNQNANNVLMVCDLVISIEDVTKTDGNITIIIFYPETMNVFKNRWSSNCWWDISVCWSDVLTNTPEFSDVTCFFQSHRGHCTITFIGWGIKWQIHSFFSVAPL